MTRIEHTKCPTCAHYREQPYPVPTCAKATHPRGGDAQVACVVAWERCEGKYWEARK